MQVCRYGWTRAHADNPPPQSSAPAALSRFLPEAPKRLPSCVNGAPKHSRESRSPTMKWNKWSRMEHFSADGPQKSAGRTCNDLRFADNGCGFYMGPIWPGGWHMVRLAVVGCRDLSGIEAVLGRLSGGRIAAVVDEDRRTVHDAAVAMGASVTARSLRRAPRRPRGRRGWGVHQVWPRDARNSGQKGRRGG